ncbi:MAG: bifunctional diaminohydroxyphosphoribosylaminopyrimidine deaminase/5-amino-6-(5-phosphoribosylamino)uracil reductase RibD [Candidatus Loosdrechtia sp.]|uniref:bifunctional diaminohydroxyphosphoribosylaminopyrimidine deaminase/5-amino-6-(5-phosphoribosylamino)uracil reductase RibD n=1 Tax=Candidatus Loosdrechtia sp. TaxID=3101272 RepID=UPI003A6F22EA|nr:MAG: bifunctional diaminohydroxyphosphoribosylaminopyrimidine deaminase/5-amino-6-(5-phosphoribosylamino)uracil reductase RibD [Candidatus Jettenia sp. AMX2]
MAIALELAEKGRGKVEPNPMVGAVLVKNGEIVGTGYHQSFGGAHAEMHAIKEGGDNCRGAALYVSMEPCAHYGKTAPCTDAIIKAGIVRVVLAIIDPNPVTSGKGIQQLKDAGVEVTVGVMEKEAKRLNTPFLKMMQRGLPYVIVKWAMSLDGKIATRTGDSKWISCEESREYVHKIRGQVDGILVGINTVLRDDPLLTCRIEGGRNPRRIIVDSNASLPLNCRLISTLHESEVIVAVNQNAPQQRIGKLQQSGCRVLQIKSPGRLVDLKGLLVLLAEMRLTNILVEGGSRVITSLIDEHLADKGIIFIAPIIIGGEGADSPVLGKGIENISEAVGISDILVKRFLDDIVIEGILNYNY